MYLYHSASSLLNKHYLQCSHSWWYKLNSWCISLELSRLTIVTLLLWHCPAYHFIFWHCPVSHCGTVQSTTVALSSLILSLLALSKSINVCFDTLSKSQNPASRIILSAQVTKSCHYLTSLLIVCSQHTEWSMNFVLLIDISLSSSGLN